MHPCLIVFGFTPRERQRDTVARFSLATFLANLYSLVSITPNSA